MNCAVKNLGDPAQMESTPTAGSKFPRTEYLWLAGILSLALTLRLINLGKYAFWHDEIHNILMAENLREALLSAEQVSNHPPLITVLLYVWTHLGLGGSEMTVRLLPVTLGMLGFGSPHLDMHKKHTYTLRCF